MFVVLYRILETFVTELVKKLAGMTLKQKRDIWKDTLGLYYALGDLLHAATHLFDQLDVYGRRFAVLSKDNAYREGLRESLRAVLHSLRAFEDRLKPLFVTLRLVVSEDLTIRLVQVPESSFSLFKKHFMDDIAPKAVATSTGDKYILRIALQKHDRRLVDVNSLGQLSLDLDRLHREGTLDYEYIDFADKKALGAVRRQGRKDLLSLKRLLDDLGQLLKDKVARLEDIL